MYRLDNLGKCETMFSNTTFEFELLLNVNTRELFKLSGKKAKWTDSDNARNAELLKIVHVEEPELHYIDYTLATEYKELIVRNIEKPLQTAYSGMKCIHQLFPIEGTTTQVNITLQNMQQPQQIMLGLVDTQQLEHFGHWNEKGMGKTTVLTWNSIWMIQKIKEANT